MIPYRVTRLVLTLCGMNRARVDPRTHRRSISARRVRDLLRAAIIHEEIPVGALPGESELMLAFSASRQVIRDALALLRDEGLVDRLQGCGTLVVASKVRHHLTHLHGPEPIRQQVVTHRVLTATVERTAPRVAERLGIPLGMPSGVIDYVTTLDGEPYSLVTTYVPLDVLELVAGIREFSDWYRLLESAGHELGTTDQAIEAILADELVSEYLAIPPGSPLVLFERRINDRGGRPLDYAFARVRADRLALMTRLPRHGHPGEA
jgi:GntR family transcriptional regulator